jgi:hypothetical protein
MASASVGALYLIGATPLLLAWVNIRSVGGFNKGKQNAS